MSNSQVSDNEAAVCTPPVVCPFLGKRGRRTSVHVNVMCDSTRHHNARSLLRSICTRVHFNIICITTIILFYRPPSSPVDDLLTTLQIVNPAGFSNFIIAGDFTNYSHTQDILLRFSVTQVVSSHTHISPSGNPHHCLT